MILRSEYFHDSLLVNDNSTNVLLFLLLLFLQKTRPDFNKLKGKKETKLYWL